MSDRAEEFFRDVRRAARMERKPVATTDSQLFDPDTATKVLRRATTWLTPKVVANYDPSEFASSPGTVQQELRTAVDEFRVIASTVRPDEPATGQQFREGLKAFGRLASAVRNVVLADWEDAANGLLGRIEGWAADSGWVTRRVGKGLSELLIGDYRLDQLYLYAEGNLYVLDPQARFIPGGLGAFDLSIQPSFFVTSIYRHRDGVWYVHLDVGRGVRGAKAEPLERDSFGQALAELRSLL